MSAHILTFRPARLPQAEAARRRAMLLHPSNFISESAPAGGSGKEAEELAVRFDSLYQEFLDQGLPANQARTEVARTAARDIWDAFASRLRGHRAAGQQLDANVLAVALASIQCMNIAPATAPGRPRPRRPCRPHRAAPPPAQRRPAGPPAPAPKPGVP